MPNQRGHSLRSFAGNGVVEKFVGQQQRVDVGADLGQKTVGQILRRLFEEDRAKAQAAARGLFHNAQAFDGAIAVFGALGARERLAQFLHQRVVAAFDAAQPVLGGRGF